MDLVLIWRFYLRLSYLLQGKNRRDFNETKLTYHIMKLRLSKNICVDWEHLLQSYKTFVNKDSIVLEIGASAKERTAELAKYCHKLIGVENFPERKPKDFENVEYLLGDWQNLSEFIQPETVDVAVASHVIEHIPDDLRAINELYAVLKPGGVAIINTPNRKRFVRAIIEVFTGDREFPYWEHVREYTENDVFELLNRSLFKNFKIVPVGFGIHGGPVFCFSESIPQRFRKFYNFLEIHLFKDNNL